MLRRGRKRYEEENEENIFICLSSCRGRTHGQVDTQTVKIDRVRKNRDRQGLGHINRQSQ